MAMLFGACLDSDNCRAQQTKSQGPKTMQALRAPLAVCNEILQAVSCWQKDVFCILNLVGRPYLIFLIELLPIRCQTRELVLIL